jgi:hypothetical protein
MLPPDDDYLNFMDVMPPEFYIENREVFDNRGEAEAVWNDLVDYFPGDTGFSHEQWMSMSFDISNLWFDDDGIAHYDFYWESPDGRYSGNGHR